MKTKSTKKTAVKKASKEQLKNVNGGLFRDNEVFGQSPIARNGRLGRP